MNINQWLFKAKQDDTVIVKHINLFLSFQSFQLAWLFEIYLLQKDFI